MHKLIIFTLLCLLFISCSSTKYVTEPSWGYEIKPGEKFIVRITNKDFYLHPKSTKATIDVLKECTYFFMSVTELDSINYRFLLHLEDSWIPDSLTLKRLNAATNFDYFLTGGWATSQVHPNSIYKLSDYEIENNIDPSAVKEKFVYLLYDIKTQKRVLSLTTNSKSKSIGFENNRKFRFPMNTEAKALKILKEKLGCNYYEDN